MLTIKRAFLRHELWAIKMAQAYPIAALYFMGSLWVWGLPLIPLSFSLVVGMIRLFEMGRVIPATALSAVGTFIGIAFLVIVAPWFIRWYFLAFGLMMGRGAMAERKLLETRKRLETLYT